MLTCVELPGINNRSDEYATGLVESPLGKRREHMSEQTNSDVVQQAYEAFGRGDIPAVLDTLTDDVE